MGSALAASFKCVRSVWQVENIHLRNETLRMQHALMHTRTEVSGLEGDLSVVQAENRLQGSRLPQLRSQVRCNKPSLRSALKDTPAGRGREKQEVTAGGH